MYQVILINDKNGNKYYQSYVESDDIALGNITTDELPPYADINKAKSCYWDNYNKIWVYDSDKYNNIISEQEILKIKQLTDISPSNKLQLFADIIQVEEAPTENGRTLPKKDGYIWKNVCKIIDGTPYISWELAVDPNYIIDNDGTDYLKAIIWHNGDTVIEGLWYNVGNDLIWQALKTGIPLSSKDKEYFDIY